MTQQAGAAEGCPTVLVFSDDFKALALRVCARLKISSECRPSPAEARDFASAIGIPTTYGEFIYRTLLQRCLRFLETHVTAGHLPNALVLGAQSGNAQVFWKAHTRHWTDDAYAQATFEELRNETSDGLRAFKASQAKLGPKRILDGAVGMIAESGVWDDAEEFVKVMSEGDKGKSKGKKGKPKGEKIQAPTPEASEAEASDSPANSEHENSASEDEKSVAEDDASASDAPAPKPKPAIRAWIKKFVGSEVKRLLKKGLAPDAPEIKKLLGLEAELKELQNTVRVEGSYVSQLSHFLFPQ